MIMKTQHGNEVCRNNSLECKKKSRNKNGGLKETRYEEYGRNDDQQKLRMKRQCEWEESDQQKRYGKGNDVNQLLTWERTMINVKRIHKCKCHNRKIKREMIRGNQE